MTPGRRRELREQAEQAGSGSLVVIPAADLLDLLDTTDRLRDDLARGFDEFAELREQDR